MTTLFTTCLANGHANVTLLEEFVGKNLKESMISGIVVLAEKATTRDAQKLEKKYPGASILPVSNRPCFTELIEISKKRAIDCELTIICNSDIWLKDSSEGLSEIKTILLKNPDYALTLTRREDHRCDSLLSTSGILPELASSDAWIFLGKPRHLPLRKEIRLGGSNIEDCLNSALIGAGYKLANACNHIAAINLKTIKKNCFANGTDTHMLRPAESTSSRSLLYKSMSILPLPGSGECPERLNAIERTVAWDKYSTKYVCIELNYSTKESLVYSLNFLCYIILKYEYTVCVLCEASADEWALSFIKKVAVEVPRIIIQYHSSIYNKTRKDHSSDFVIAAHCGAITKQMLEEGLPIYILGMPHERVWNTSSLGTTGVPNIIGANNQEVNIDKRGYYWSHLQIITCTFGSDEYIDRFLENMATLALESAKQGLNISHTFIDLCPSDAMQAKIFAYLKNINGFYLLIKADPGLYECWNRLIRLSSDEYISNANPDDLRDPKHCLELVSLLKKDSTAMVGSSNVFPIFSKDERLLEIKTLQKNTDPGWFASTPEKYGLDHLYESNVDDQGLIKPRNIPHCAPIWRRKIHDLFGYFREDRYGSEADWAFWCHYASSGGEFLHCPKSLSGYFIDELSYGRQKTDVSARLKIILDFIINDKIKHKVGLLCSELVTQEVALLACANQKEKKYNNSFMSPEALKCNSKEIRKSERSHSAVTINVYGQEGNYGNHRFSNNSIIKSLLPHHSEGAEIQFLWFLEKYFLWGTDPGEKNSGCFKPLRHPWVGILHVPPLTPSWAGNQFSELFIQSEWNESLLSCRGIIVLSESMLIDLKKLYPGLPIYAIKHPLGGQPTEAFSMQRFMQDPKIVLAGYWLRNHIGFYKWAAPFKKIHILKDTSLDQMHREFSYFNFDAQNYINTVEQVPFMPDSEYDSLISSSILYLDMYDTSANNAILECIATGTPFLSRRLPAVEEYVGTDYPLLVDNPNEINLSKSKLVDLAYQAHCHLREKTNVACLSLDSFRHNILDIIASSVQSP